MILVVVTLGFSVASSVFISGALNRQDEAFSRLAAIESGLDQLPEMSVDMVQMEESDPEEVALRQTASGLKGSAIVSGTWVEAGRNTSFDESGGTALCRGVKVVDAPELLEDYLLNRVGAGVVPREGGNPVIIVGDIESGPELGTEAELLITVDEAVTGGGVIDCQPFPSDITIL